MIAVIADDMTGAAELAAIGMRYGLRTLISDRSVGRERPDLLVVCSDSRSKPRDEAIQITRSLSEAIRALNPQLVYKKTDSVLRGYVMDEIRIVASCFDKDKVLLVPANPGLGRTIRKGLYYVDGELINTTSFAWDPEFPIRTAVINELVPGLTGVLETRSELSGDGVFLGEAAALSDLAHWSKILNDDIMPAGGAEFFDAILRHLFGHTRPLENLPPWDAPVLWVCGTSFRESIAYLEDTGVHLTRFDPVSGISQVQKAELLKAAMEEGKAALVIDQKGGRREGEAKAIRERMAQAVKDIIAEARVGELIIEGGSTASSILHALDIQQLEPVEELAEGVVRMKNRHSSPTYITIKPGSYRWPANMPVKT